MIKLSLPLLLLFALTGCATWADTARTTIEVSAVAVDVADHSVAAALSATCSAVEVMPVGEERSAALDACLSTHHYDDAIAAIRVADRSLRAAQAAVDTGEQLDDKAPWVAIAACLTESIGQVLAALTEAGVAVPPALTAGVAALAGFTGTCSAEVGGAS